MQFWLKSLMVVGLGGWLVGCSSSDDRVLDDDHKYLSAVEGKVLKVPESLTAPSGDNSFYLPAYIGIGPVGGDLDITAPLQLLTLASGSRIDENNRTNMMWFDQTTVVDDMDSFIWDSMVGFLSDIGVKDSIFNPITRVIDTGLVTDRTEGSFWFWGDDDLTQSYRFKMLSKVLPHGRSGYVSVFLSGYQRNGVELPLSAIDPIVRSNIEIGFLNQYVYHYQVLQEILVEKTDKSGNVLISLKTGQNSKAQSALTSSHSTDETWVDFRTLLENLGFTIDDVDRSVKKMYVTYKPEEKGFWASLWGNTDMPALKLDKVEYMIQITENDETGGSFITWFDKNEQPLPDSVYQAIEADLMTVAKRLSLNL